MSHVFYDTRQLSLTTKTDILNKSIIVAYKWWVDELKTFRREKIEMPQKEIIQKLSKSCHFTVIKRWDCIEEIYFGELGFSTIGGEPDYFLFIEMSETDLDIIVNEFDLSSE